MPQKRIYIASKVATMLPAVKALIPRLQALGYTITYDWTLYDVPRPYKDHPEEARNAANQMIYGVMQCDILVVLCAPGGLGYHIETGLALHVSALLAGSKGEKKIYVVGEGNDRSVFYFHKSMERLPDIDTLLEKLA